MRCDAREQASKLKVMACEREMPEARLDFVARTALAYLSTDIPNTGKPPDRGRLLVEDLFTADVIAAKAGT
jgi:hypothetical protein